MPCRFARRKVTKLKKYTSLIIFLALTVFWIGFIWSNSADNGAESGEKSSAVVEAIEDTLGSVGLDVSVSEHFIRKAAHFTEYMLLALLLCADAYILTSNLTGFGIKAKLVCVMCAPIDSMLVALVDEFVIQASTAGRGPAFTDVMIDTLGALVGALGFAAAVLIMHLRRRHSD